jgi:hypothetical protein
MNIQLTIVLETLPQQSKVRLFIPFEMATIVLFHSVDFLYPEILSFQLQ